MRFAPRANISRRLKTRRLARPRPSRPSSSPDPIRRRSGLARTSVDFDRFLKVCEGLPDPKDAHVLAAALKTQASVIVTENLKHFPEDILTPLSMNARSSDCFIADTIALEEGRAVAAIKRPARTAEELLLLMEARGLTETVDVLKPHIESL
jgi:hypothetical protein